MTWKRPSYQQEENGQGDHSIEMDEIDLNTVLNDTDQDDIQHSAEHDNSQLDNTEQHYSEHTV